MFDPNIIGILYCVIAYLITFLLILFYLDLEDPTMNGYAYFSLFITFLFSPFSLPLIMLMWLFDF